MIRLLGSGGCGRVYLAENIRTKSLWAIKEIPCDSSNLHQVEREIDVLKKVRHPALPRIVDVLHENGMFYLIEDYFEGRNVDEILREQKFVSAGAAVKWALEICDIMIFLHGQAPEPIIYRDLKPSNIILSPDGSIRLVDFGSVRRYKSDSPSDTVYIGTRGYAAPEQYGFGQTSEQTDVYSFGMTMWHIITGKRPVESSINCMGIKGGGIGRNEIDEGGFDAPQAIPNCIKAILSRCTEWDPGKRFQSFQDIKMQLLSYVKESINAADSSHYDGDGGDGAALRSAGGGDAARCGTGGNYAAQRVAGGNYAAQRVAGGGMSCLELPRPLGFYRCITISVAQNHEFAFEFASRISEKYGLKTLILDCDFESSFSELYFTSDNRSNPLYENNSLYMLVKLIEKNTYIQNDNARHKTIPKNYNALNQKHTINFHFDKIINDNASSSGSDNGSYRNIDGGWDNCNGDYYDDCYNDCYNDGDSYSDCGSESVILDGLPGLVPCQSGRPEPIWLYEPNPEYSGQLAKIFVNNRGIALRRLLAEITVYADICIILTGQSVLSDLNMRCFQNSHYIIYPGQAEYADIKTFNKTAFLADRDKGIPSNRFKYIIWEYKQSEAKPEAIWELGDESLAGFVRKSKRREISRRGKMYNGCYAFSMERAVKKDYDGIINALGVIK